MILLVFALILNGIKNIRREILSEVNQECQWIPEPLATQEKDQLKRQRTRKGSKKQKHRRERDLSRSSSSSPQSFHSYKAEKYPKEAEESTSGFDQSRLGTKYFLGPNERGGRAWGMFQFPRGAGGRGWGRGNYSGNNNNHNKDFQQRSREEERDPEYTPKSKKYYLHDDRVGKGSDK